MPVRRGEIYWVEFNRGPASRLRPPRGENDLRPIGGLSPTRWPRSTPPCAATSASKSGQVQVERAQGGHDQVLPEQPFIHGLAVPLLRRLRGNRTVHLELTPLEG